MKAKLAGGLKITQKSTHFDSRSIIKVGITGQTNICMYLGLKYSFDGFAFLIGMKIGAMKMIFPILVLNPSGKSKQGAIEAPEESDNISVYVGYLISQSILGWLNARKQTKEIEKWRADVLPSLRAQHERDVSQLA